MDSYKQEMRQMIDKGFLGISSDKDTVLRHYIAHQSVLHPQKGSLRVVWDCAVSWNDFIHENPNLRNSLVEVLIRFSRYPYAACSDIRRMLKRKKKWQRCFRVLWCPDHDLSAELVEYSAAVDIFGTKPSDFIANYCVQSLENCK